MKCVHVAGFVTVKLPRTKKKKKIFMGSVNFSSAGYKTGCAAPQLFQINCDLAATVFDIYTH